MKIFANLVQEQHLYICFLVISCCTPPLPLDMQSNHQPWTEVDVGIVYILASETVK
jgi:hypothetical protein